MDDTSYDPELELLGGTSNGDSASNKPNHALRTAPVFTGDALHLLGTSVMPQRALYGRVIAQKGANFEADPNNQKMYINTNAPFSALVCGVQGSGKSHSTSVLLESCLMSDSRLGTLPAPLSAIVFHFDTAAGGGAVQPCEAAYLGTLDAERGGNATPPTVTVLVLPNNLAAMRRVYAGLPTVRVEPLRFSAEDISGERLLAMMKVDENTQMPLYMEAIMSILRSMESHFDYVQFRDQLKAQKFNPGQKAMLNLRLGLLDSCLEGGNLYNRVSTHFRKGQLTIIDLSSPFMDSTSACGFFDLILGLFVEADVDVSGKLIVLDEAHKYLSESQSGTSARLTDSLLTIIRQQRHLATRVLISTQEPTVVPSKFLDLCSFIIAHRFSSPKWLRLLANHISAAESSFDELFSKVVSLETGQAIMFAPNGLGVRTPTKAATADDDDNKVDESLPANEVAPLGQGYFIVHSRLRVTRDGGHSILAVSDPDSTTRLGRVHTHSDAGGSERTTQDDNDESHASASARHTPRATQPQPQPRPQPQHTSPPTAGVNKPTSKEYTNGAPAPSGPQLNGSAPPFTPPVTSATPSFAPSTDSTPPSSTPPVNDATPSWASAAKGSEPSTTSDAEPSWDSTAEHGEASWGSTAEHGENSWGSTNENEADTWGSTVEHGAGSWGPSAAHGADAWTLPPGSAATSWEVPTTNSTPPAASRPKGRQAQKATEFQPRFSNGFTPSSHTNGSNPSSHTNGSTPSSHTNGKNSSQGKGKNASPSPHPKGPTSSSPASHANGSTPSAKPQFNTPNPSTKPHPKGSNSSAKSPPNGQAASSKPPKSSGKKQPGQKTPAAPASLWTDLVSPDGNASSWNASSTSNWGAPAAPQAAPAATPNNAPNRVIDLRRHARFGPLMKYVLAVRKPGDFDHLKISVMHKWFKNNAPDAYDNQLQTFKQLCFDAIQAGILASSDALPSDPSGLYIVTLARGVEYLNY